MKRREVLKAIAVMPAAVRALAQTPDWTPVFFTPLQNDTFTTFADLVIPTTDTPGARDALVNRYLDKILAASDPSVQNQVVADLAALGPNFTSITPQLARTAAFARLKGWTSRLYYATKPGYDDLNLPGQPQKPVHPRTFACG